MSELRHHSLVAWQRADAFFLKIHRLTHASFPAFERYELAGQMRRAAYSVPANIAKVLRVDIGAPLVGLVRSVRRMPPDPT
jgi:hypothetical protein